MYLLMNFWNKCDSVFIDELCVYWRILCLYEWICLYLSRKPYDKDMDLDYTTMDPDYAVELDCVYAMNKLEEIQDQMDNVIHFLCLTCFKSYKYNP